MRKLMPPPSKESWSSSATIKSTNTKMHFFKDVLNSMFEVCFEAEVLALQYLFDLIKK